MRKLPSIAVLLGTFSLCGCASDWVGGIMGDRQPAISVSEAETARQAILEPAPQPPARQPSAPEKAAAQETMQTSPLPEPRQTRSKQRGRTEKASSEPADPPIRIDEANRAARVQPRRADYRNATQVYHFADGALYQVYVAPGNITDVALQPGEKLVGSGAVAAGDTVRWVIGVTESGTGALARSHILVKPTAPELVTNLVVNTDRRTYHIELRSIEKTYMASVSWTYPTEPPPVTTAQGGAPGAPAANPDVDVNDLHFGYRIDGDDARWRPLRAFDDGRRVFIEFPREMSPGDVPPLWVIGASGQDEPVKYRVQGNRMIVDRLFAAAELRVGSERQQVVRIVSTERRPQS